MPRIAGPWLAGTFDHDRAAARAAGDALNLVFATSEKVQGVRRAFQQSILEYCRDAALQETVQTLSDERIVSSEDAKATYARVVATSLSAISSLINELPRADQEREDRLYEEILSENRLWEMVYALDAGVRRSMHRLIQTSLEKHPNLIQDNIKTVSNAYVYKGLNSDQTGSALDFVQTLEALTAALPTMWTEAYSGKRPAGSRLRQSLKQGSQSAPAEFWDCLSKLFRKLPQQILPSAVEEITELLLAAHIGVSKKEERFNISSAWPAYFTLVDVVASFLSDQEAESILDSHVMPVLRQYLYPGPETADWSVTGAKAAWTVSQAALVKGFDSILTREWPLLADRLIEVARLSQPEQSKDFDKSQRHVATTGERWAGLQRELWARYPNSTDIPTQTFASTSTKILEECVSLLKQRNGKPYGAAAIVEQLLRTCAEKLLSVEMFRASYMGFAEHDVSELILSPSQRQLIHGLFAIQSESEFSKVFAGILRKVLEADISADVKIDALRTIFTHSIPAKATKVAEEMPEFQNFLVQGLTTKQAESTTSLFADLIKLHAVTAETTDTILSNLTATLRMADVGGAGLTAIELLSRTSESTVKTFMTEPSGNGAELLPNLLRLEQSSDDVVAEKAAALASHLSSAISATAGDARYIVVLQNLERVSDSSMSMDAVHDLTTKLLGPDRNIQSASEMLPSLDVWRSALRATLKPPKPSLALLSPFGGAVHLVRHDVNFSDQSVQYDAEGLSQALRIAVYVVKLLAGTNLLQCLGGMKATVLALVQISVLIAEDNLSILGANQFWRRQGTDDIESAVLDFVSEANQILSACWNTMLLDLNGEATTESSQFFSALEKLREDDQALAPLSYYVALSSARVYGNLFELHGFSTDQSQRGEAVFKDCRKTDQQLPLMCCIVGYQQPLSGTQTLTRYCNELVAELTDVNMEEKQLEALEQLTFLNVLLRTQEDLVAAIAKQRIIFLVKRLMPWLESNVSITVKSEVFKALAELLPGIADMYGEHWEQALSCVIDSCRSVANDAETRTIDEANVLTTYTSLRLLATLKKLAKSDEANDDLVEALDDKRDNIHDVLMALLVSANGISDETHQPLMITHELLARQIASLPYKALKDVDDLYPLLYASSRSIQHAAFDLLHKHIPAAQEQVSFDAALDNKTAQLPDELLSLILEAPTLDSLADASFYRMMPLSLQGYLFSWRLLFDHFKESSYRVKSDYIEQLKDGTYLSGLLGFTFHFLGHSRGRPVDVSKFDIQEYVPDTASSPEKDVQWLLTHLYFLALTHLPSLVKSYYLDIRSRQTSLAVENWTAKYISPLIVEASLRAVAEWSAKSVSEDPEYEKMTVKVGMRSKEINVSYVVDEQTMAMKVVLPEAYPLASAQVVGVSRVAVKEEKWQSWLRNCQGVITFSVSTWNPQNYRGLY